MQEKRMWPSQLWDWLQKKDGEKEVFDKIVWAEGWVGNPYTLLGEYWEDLVKEHNKDILDGVYDRHKIMTVRTDGILDGKTWENKTNGKLEMKESHYLQLIFYLYFNKDDYGYLNVMERPYEFETKLVSKILPDYETNPLIKFSEKTGRYNFFPVMGKSFINEGVKYFYMNLIKEETVYKDIKQKLFKVEANNELVEELLPYIENFVKAMNSNDFNSYCIMDKELKDKFKKEIRSCVKVHNEGEGYVRNSF